MANLNSNCPVAKVALHSDKQIIIYFRNKKLEFHIIHMYIYTELQTQTFNQPES